LDEHIKIGGLKATKPQLMDGIKIVGVQTTVGRRKSLLKRFINYISFSYMSYLVGYRIEKPDIIIVGTPPLIVPLTGLLLGWKHKAYTILEIRDLYPETAVVLEKVRNKTIQFLWESWENLLRKKYNHIVAVVPRIKMSLVKKGFVPDKISTIINGFDIENDETCVLPNEIEDFFIKNSKKYVIIYGGGMGHGINLKTVIQAGEICQENSKIIIALFGEGDLKNQYIEYVNKKGLANIFFFSAQTRKVINEVFRRADALVHSFINNDFFKCALPNKIFEYHGSGNPIVFAGKGDTADLINEAGSGIVVEPENPKQMAEAFQYLANNREDGIQMGKSGSVYIKKYYRRETTFAKWQKIIENKIN